MTPISIASYARTLRAVLPSDAFAPVPSRLLWLAVYLPLIIVSTVAIAVGWGGWPVRLALALVIGNSFAGLAFVGHELLHGAIVRHRRLRYLVGWLCLLPFNISPRLWIAWHNRVHHGHTMKEGVDPDAYPTLSAYRQSRLLRAADYLAPALGRWLGWLSLVLGFTIQSQQVLLFQGRSAGYLSPRQHLAAVLETLLGVAAWAGLGWLIGPVPFVFAFVVPLLIANVVVMSYILTNHSLSPLTETNDPLLNTLTVTTPRIFSLLHLNFGMHVEHHLFPAMSSVHAGAVRAQLLRLWPERYQSMSLPRALGRLFGTPRIYKDAMTLVDPHSGSESLTLQPAGSR
jgi:fatty acid desaturase